MEYDYEAGAGGYQFHELKLASCFRGDEYGVSSVSFDPQEDLLWAATYEVHLIMTLRTYLYYLSFLYIGSRDLLLQFIPGEVHCIPGTPCRHTAAAANRERHTQHDGQGVTSDHSYGASPLHTA